MMVAWWACKLGLHHAGLRPGVRGGSRASLTPKQPRTLSPLCRAQPWTLGGGWRCRSGGAASATRSWQTTPHTSRRGTARGARGATAACRHVPALTESAPDISTKELGQHDSQFNGAQHGEQGGLRQRAGTSLTNVFVWYGSGSDYAGLGVQLYKAPCLATKGQGEHAGMPVQQPSCWADKEPRLKGSWTWGKKGAAAACRQGWMCDAVCSHGQPREVSLSNAAVLGGFEASHSRSSSTLHTAGPANFAGTQSKETQHEAVVFNVLGLRSRPSKGRRHAEAAAGALLALSVSLQLMCKRSGHAKHQNKQHKGL